MSEAGTPSTEELQTTIEPLHGDGGSSADGKSTPSQKRPRTEAQMHALLNARKKALMVRQQNADLKRKQQEIDRATLAKAKQDERERIEREYNSLHAQRPKVVTGASLPTAPPIEEEDRHTIRTRPEEEKIREKPRKRKPARRVIVTEASSGSETEEEVEVQLPRQRRPRSAEEISYQRAMSKMFEYQ